MGQFSKILLAIDNAQAVPQRALDCGPGLSGLNGDCSKSNIPVVLRPTMISGPETGSKKKVGVFASP